MNKRLSTLRFLSLSAGLALISVGCTSSNKVTFTNVSDSWLNVRYFVMSPDVQTEVQNEFVSDTRLQVRPGETAKYALTRNPNYVGSGDSLVHVQVEPVTPSWQPSGKEYWLELLTPPPVTIVATGEAHQLMFNTGDGAVAIIPEHEIRGGRFDHKMVSAPETETPD